MIYKNNKFSKILFDGGYVDARYLKITNPGRPLRQIGMTDEEYQNMLEGWIGNNVTETMELGFMFYVKDHLGNNRIVIDKKGNVRQTTDYYPFGTPFYSKSVTINQVTQPFKYNGKWITGSVLVDHGVGSSGSRGRF